MPDFNLNKAVEWPYPVNYGKENEVEADVLILGGGVAGSHAAISAAKKQIVFFIPFPPSVDRIFPKNS